MPPSQTIALNSAPIAGHSLQPSGRLSALQAGRAMATAMRVAPGAAAGAVAAQHTGRLGIGVLVAVSCATIAIAVGSRRWPLHLMPFAGVVVRLLMPVAGIGLAVGVAALVDPLPAVDLLSALAAAWVVGEAGRAIASRVRHGAPVRLGVIGSQGLTESLRAELQIAGLTGYVAVGWIDFDGAPGPVSGGARKLGHVDDLADVVVRHDIDLLVNGVAESLQSGTGISVDVLDRAAASCLHLPVRLIGANQLYEELFAHLPLGTLDASWFRYVMHPSYWRVSEDVNRAFHLALAALMLLLASPLLAIAAVAIKLTDGGPVIFRQRRIGAGGAPFDVLKLRTMSVDAEAGGARWASRDDDRVTRVGRILRRIHLDEMPQLWNVLRGEMAVVGPRPERPEFVSSLERQLRFYDRRHLMRPGITGWAQVRIGYAGSEGGTAWKLAHDLYYLKHRSVIFDLMILVETLPTPLRDDQAEERSPDQRFVLEAVRRGAPALGPEAAAAQFAANGGGNGNGTAELPEPAAPLDPAGAESYPG